MSDDRPLSDNEVHDRLHAALEALGKGTGETTRGDTALDAARKALGLLQWGLLCAMERKDDNVMSTPPWPSTEM